MGVQFKEVLKPQKIGKDKLPQKKSKSDFRGDFVGDFDDSIELSHLSIDIRFYSDNPKDSE
jgi:hypothetical protein